MSNVEQQPVQPGRYICECDDPNAAAPRSEVLVINDERGFPTIFIDEEKRWPVHMLPDGCRLLNHPLRHAPANPHR